MGQHNKIAEVKEKNYLLGGCPTPGLGENVVGPKCSRNSTRSKYLGPKCLGTPEISPFILTGYNDSWS